MIATLELKINKISEKKSFKMAIEIKIQNSDSSNWEYSCFPQMDQKFDPNSINSKPLGQIGSISYYIFFGQLGNDIESFNFFRKFLDLPGTQNWPWNCVRLADSIFCSEGLSLFCVFSFTTQVGSKYINMCLKTGPRVVKGRA